MAQRYWAGRNPVGGRLEQFGRSITIVGVVENAVTTDLRGQPAPFVYLAFDQWLTGKWSIALDPAHLFVRTPFLVGVNPLDPLTFAAVTILLSTIALIASYLPARRAARMEPTTALRDE